MKTKIKMKTKNAYIFHFIIATRNNSVGWIMVGAHGTFTHSNPHCTIGCLIVHSEMLLYCMIQFTNTVAYLKICVYSESSGTLFIVNRIPFNMDFNISR